MKVQTFAFLLLPVVFVAAPIVTNPPATDPPATTEAPPIETEAPPIETTEAPPETTEGPTVETCGKCRSFCAKNPPNGNRKACKGQCSDVCPGKGNTRGLRASHLNN